MRLACVKSHIDLIIGIVASTKDFWVNAVGPLAQYFCVFDRRTLSNTQKINNFLQRSLGEMKASQ